MNISLDKIGEKNLFVLWMDIREKVYGEQSPLFIPDQSLLEWGKRRVQLKKNQNLLGNLFTRILHPIRISLALTKPKRRINP